MGGYGSGRILWTRFPGGPPARSAGAGRQASPRSPKSTYPSSGGVIAHTARECLAGVPGPRVPTARPKQSLGRCGIALPRGRGGHEIDQATGRIH